MPVRRSSGQTASVSACGSEQARGCDRGSTKLQARKASVCIQLFYDYYQDSRWVSIWRITPPSPPHPVSRSFLTRILPPHFIRAQSSGAPGCSPRQRPIWLHWVLAYHHYVSAFGGRLQQEGSECSW
eukprot:933895-Rhodomonas_salina.1